MREYCVCFMNTNTGMFDECFTYAYNKAQAYAYAKSKAPRWYQFFSVSVLNWA